MVLIHQRFLLPQLAAVAAQRVMQIKQVAAVLVVAVLIQLGLNLVQAVHLDKATLVVAEITLVNMAVAVAVKVPLAHATAAAGALGLMVQPMQAAAEPAVMVLLGAAVVLAAAELVVALILVHQ
jgi:hypothetical protein